MSFCAYILQPEKRTIRIACPTCADRGIVLYTCPICSGKGVVTQNILQYKVSEKPITIQRLDRDTKTGILRYWTSDSDYFYETTTHDLNPYVPNIPHGIHLVSSTYEMAKDEADRVNCYLRQIYKKAENNR